MSVDGRFDRRYNSRSRSRSPFRKNFNERSYNDDDFKSRRLDLSPDVRRASTVKNRVFVNNIPFECRWMELKDLFREKVGDVAFVELFDDDNGKFKGCGVVEFKDSETANKAVELMHKHELRGRQLNVKLDTGEMERRRMPPRGSDLIENEDFRHDPPPFNTYGLSPRFLRSLGIQGPLNNKVFISNLDYKVNEKKLEEVFRLAGKLVKAELNVDNEGKSKGHGTAEYEHPLAAVQAISMLNGQRLYARIINVRMDKFVEDDAMPSKLPAGLHGIGKGLGMNGQPMQFSKNSTSPNGSFGYGMNMGSMGSGISSGGIGISSSSLMLSSSGMGLGSTGSMGMSNSMASDRMMGASMNMSSSSMSLSSPSMGIGMGISPSMGSVMGRSSLDSMGRDGSYQLGNGGRSYRDGFERSNDAFNSSSLSDTVVVGNLPSTFSWQSLKDRFRDIGDVRFAELKGQGTALVRFSTIQDAQRAVDLMNGFRIDGRQIQVRFY